MTESRLSYQGLIDFIAHNKPKLIISDYIKRKIKKKSLKAKRYSDLEFIKEYSLAGYGEYKVEITMEDKKIIFEHLQATASKHYNFCSLGLRFYKLNGLPVPSEKSQFYDDENVYISFMENQFISAERVTNKNIIYLKMKTWTATITWS